MDRCVRHFQTGFMLRVVEAYIAAIVFFPSYILRMNQFTVFKLI